MAYLLPVIAVVLGFGMNTVIEIAAELSSDTLNDSDAGVAVYESSMIAGDLVDMRPETSLALRQPSRPTASVAAE